MRFVWCGVVASLAPNACWSATTYNTVLNTFPYENYVLNLHRLPGTKMKSNIGAGKTAERVRFSIPSIKTLLKLDGYKKTKCPQQRVGE